MAANVFQAKVKEWIDLQQPTTRYALASRRLGRIPDPSELTKEQLGKTNEFLDRLGSAKMSADLLQSAHIKDGLERIARSEEFHFPEEVKQRAEGLLQRFEAENWGTGAAPAAPAADNDDNSNNDASNSDSVVPQSAAIAPVGAQGNTTVTVVLNAANHPEFGPNGMFHGLVLVNGHWRIDKSIPHLLANRVGHNSLRLGDWWYNRHCVLRDGGHGHSQAGVAGNQTDGAISIAISKVYEGVDEDRGYLIYYSAPGSEKNKDPISLPNTNGSRHLMISLQNHNPVRVFRAANKSAWAPSVGIRYDGLYRVVGKQEGRTNDKGGRITSFLLRRDPGQESLESIMARSPTAQQVRDYYRLKSQL